MNTIPPHIKARNTIPIPKRSILVLRNFTSEMIVYRQLDQLHSQQCAWMGCHFGTCQLRVPILSAPIYFLYQQMPSSVHSAQAVEDFIYLSCAQNTITANLCWLQTNFSNSNTFKSFRKVTGSKILRWVGEEWLIWLIWRMTDMTDMTKSIGLVVWCPSVHAGDRGSIPGWGKYFLPRKLIGLTLVSSVSCVSSVQVLLLTNRGN